MKVMILGSSSEGNCYILKGEKETLILEAGVRFSDVKRALHFNLSDVVGCVITHEHRDHSKALGDFIGYGIKVLALDEVFDSHYIKNKAFCKAVLPSHGYSIGNFKIIALSACHDVPCVSYAITHPECGQLLFVTDSTAFNYTVSGLNHIFIECNYSSERLSDNIEQGVVPAEMGKRLPKSHMELQTTKNVLRSMDLSAVTEVLLVHLSSNNSDEGRFVKEITEVTGKPTIVAKGGMELELTKNPF